MSRSGYSDDLDQWDLIRWRGAVTSAIRGKRGQAFLRELLAALDALPEKRLARDLFTRSDGCVCALGAVAKVRGIDTTPLEPGEDDYGEVDTESVGATFGIPRALAAEIMYLNDEGIWDSGPDTPEVQFRRWQYVRKWVVGNVRNADTTSAVESKP